MPASPTLPIYRKYTNALGRLLSAAKLPCESGQEWTPISEIFVGLRQQMVPNPYGLRPGPFRKLLDAGLVPFLTEIMEDRRVQFTSEDLKPNCPLSAVSGRRARSGAEL